MAVGITTIHASTGKDDSESMQIIIALVVLLSCCCCCAFVVLFVLRRNETRRSNSTPQTFENPVYQRAEEPVDTTHTDIDSSC